MTLRAKSSYDYEARPTVEDSGVILATWGSLSAHQSTYTGAFFVARPHRKTAAMVSIRPRVLNQSKPTLERLNYHGGYMGRTHSFNVNWHDASTAKLLRALTQVSIFPYVGVMLINCVHEGTFTRNSLQFQFALSSILLCVSSRFFVAFWAKRGLLAACYGSCLQYKRGMPSGWFPKNVWTVYGNYQPGTFVFSSVRLMWRCARVRGDYRIVINV